MSKLKKVLFGTLAIGGLAAIYAVTRRKDTVSIVLKEKLTEGYIWMYTMDNEGVAEELSTDYVPAIGFNENKDAYGEHKWTFAPVSLGETLLHFSYTRPWENDENPAATATYRLRVGNDKKIHAELLDHSASFNYYAVSVK